MSSTATVTATAIWTDDRNTCKGQLRASYTVDYAVGILSNQICKHVSAVYGLDPPLEPFAMQAKCFPPDAEPSDLLSDWSSTGLTALISPDDESTRRIQTHLDKQAQADQTSDERNTTLATDTDSALISQSSTSVQPRKPKKKKKRKTSLMANPPSPVNLSQVTMDNQLKEILASMQNEISEVRRENGSMRNKNEKVLNENGNMRNEIENIRNKNEKILTENGSMRNEIQSMRNEIQSMRGDIQSMRNENERVSNENERVLEENESIRNDLVSLHKDLEAEKAQRAQDIESLREVTMLLVPLHLRVLLDLARKKVLEDLGHETWEELRDTRTVYQLADIIFNDLLKRKNLSFHPSHQSILFLCSYNNIRRAGNVAAHTAKQCDIKSAVETQTLGSNDRRCLEHLFRYAYSGALI
ncbi:hypothetical protein DEU56DRAFT_797597 [Suillus clintonianus]|uniref:uncharacterized protein n=1 Tax=Suillus clintonianus TaxID=1904413 RepID=UPI001B881C7F|nr:uncharacterized protein DEU56DRAFT_797597 [Suillus clintonianus]KAG2140593.1 hypothetical protein DEU56DRAFT_797597 [Suillus clintonianus]